MGVSADKYKSEKVEMALS
jgi:hypothetical protein